MTQPTFTPAANEKLMEYLKDFRPAVFQYGASDTTLFLNDKCSVLMTVEHNKATFDKYDEATQEPKSTLLSLLLSPLPYNAVLESLEDEIFDLIIIDGRDKLDCIKSAIPKLRDGGVLIYNATNDFKDHEEILNLLTPWKEENFGEQFQACTFFYKPSKTEHLTIEK